jgi:MerR family transcriptional regulator, mercuric resistance operon regulatory protein
MKMNSKYAKLTIGVLALEAGVSVETIRFYQRKNLMAEPFRQAGTIRRYTGADMARLQFIKSAQRIGFSLDEVAELLRLEDGTCCNEARQLAEQKLRVVRQRITALQRIEFTLNGLVEQCHTAPGQMKCPLIESLQQTPLPTQADVRDGGG